MGGEPYLVRKGSVALKYKIILVIYRGRLLILLVGKALEVRLFVIDLHVL